MSSAIMSMVPKLTCWFTVVSWSLPLCGELCYCHSLSCKRLFFNQSAFNLCRALQTSVTVPTRQFCLCKSLIVLTVLLHLYHPCNKKTVWNVIDTKIILIYMCHAFTLCGPIFDFVQQKHVEKKPFLYFVMYRLSVCEIYVSRVLYAFYIAPVAIIQLYECDYLS